MEGFLPFSRASFSLDLIAVAMLFVVPLLTTSLFLVRLKRQFQAHRYIQLSLGIGLLLIILIFEIEIRINGWTQFAEASPFFDTILYPVLAVHVTVATATTFLWIYTIFKALKNFSNPPSPNRYSKSHRSVAIWAAILMYITSLTGWLFFWMAFIA